MRDLGFHMKYAVIRLSGQEYKVSEGDTIKVNRLSEFDPKVLLYFDGSSTQVGKPYVDIKIEGEITDNVKGKKIRVGRFKAKSRYDKVRGFRPHLSVIRITVLGEASRKEAEPKTSKELISGTPKKGRGRPKKLG